MTFDRCPEIDQECPLQLANAKHSLPGKVFNKLYVFTDLPTGIEWEIANFKRAQQGRRLHDKMCSSESPWHYSFPPDSTGCQPSCYFHWQIKMNPCTFRLWQILSAGVSGKPNWGTYMQSSWTGLRPLPLKYHQDCSALRMHNQYRWPHLDFRFWPAAPIQVRDITVLVVHEKD